MRERVYIDSNVFIFPVIYEDVSKAEKAKEILKGIEDKRFSAYTSTLTWDEVTWVVLKIMGRTDSIEVGRKLLGFPNLRFIGVSEEVISKAQTLMEKYELNPRDAIHCSSALIRGIKRIISDDKDLEIVEEIERTPIEAL